MMIVNSPFFGLKFWWRIPGNQEEGSHRVHVAQGYRNKRHGDCEILSCPLTSSDCTHKKEKEALKCSLQSI